jgi:hypothetical protein
VGSAQQGGLKLVLSNLVTIKMDLYPPDVVEVLYPDFCLDKGYFLFTYVSRGDLITDTSPHVFFSPYLLLCFLLSASFLFPSTSLSQLFSSMVVNMFDL